MITDSLYFPCILFTAKFCLSCLLYKIYRENAECLKSLKKAPCFEIDHNLLEEVEKNDGVIEYAIISGSVEAASEPIISKCKPDVQGVIQEIIVKEHRLRWIRYLGSWKFVTDIINNIHHVPFVLRGKTNDLFRRGMYVRVAESLRAAKLVDSISTVYDEFKPCVTNDNATVGFFHGGETEGFQVVERMLCEGVTLTAVGKLIVESNELKIKRPNGGFGYFLTLKTKESLIDTVYDDMRLLKNSKIIVGTLTFFLFIYVSRRVYSKIKGNQEEVHWDEQRKLRRMGDKSRGLQDVNSPKCVICLDYPVEVLMLECGHAYLCFNCSEQFKYCPVCRNSIIKPVQAFWP